MRGKFVWFLLQRWRTALRLTPSPDRPGRGTFVGQCWGGYGLLLFGLFTALTAEAQLFTNLQSLIIQLPAGDPATASMDKREGPKGIDAADLDGDYSPDVVMANKDGTITVYFGEGTGRFGSPLHLQTATITLRGIVVADLTGDGLPEIISAAPFEGGLVWFHNLGFRSFGPAEFVPQWEGVRNLAAGDFDGDGRQDLVLAGTHQGVRQLRNAGNGLLVPVVDLTELRGPVDRDPMDDDFPKPPYALKVFRPPGSTRDEVIATHSESQKTWVLSPDHDGRLYVSNEIPTSQVYGLDVGQITQRSTNAVPDLVVARRRANSIEIYRGTASSQRFESEPQQSIHVEGEPRAVKVIDLDGDGWNDLVVALRRLDRVLTFRNSNGVLFVAAELPVGESPRELAVSDFNLDGAPDVAVMNRISSDATILLTFAGQVGFAGVDHMYLVDGTVVGLSVLDFNNDGRDDVIQLHQASGDFSVRLAGPEGRLAPPEYYTIGNVPSSQVIIDVNNDGFPDQVTGSLGPPQSTAGLVSVRLGNGDGTFGEERRYPLPPGKEGRLFSLLPADFDRDGNIDLVAGFLDARIGFFAGAGDGTFSFTREHDLIDGAYALAVGDFDMDGDIEVAGLGMFGQIVIAENRGDILTAPELTLTFHAAHGGASGARSLKTVDFNHDGDLDLLVGSEQGAWLYLGGGGLSFVLQPSILPGTEFSVASTLQADFDRDGVEDIIVACRIVSCLSVLTQDSEGQYAPALSVSVPANHYIATGDLDGDGLPDLIGTGKILWTALSAHSPTRTPPLQYEGQRPFRAGPVINELLAINTILEVSQDGDRFTDWVEIYNGSSASFSLGGWKLRLVSSNEVSSVTTNDFTFPPTAFLGRSRHLLVFYAEKKRTIYHTGFKLPSEGGVLTLVNPAGLEVDRVTFVRQEPNVSFGRYRDALSTFVYNPYPSPGSPNTDNGPIPPTGEFTGVVSETLLPGQRVQFHLVARDDVGLADVTLVYQRLDNPNSPVQRVVMYDDGLHNDGASGDAVYGAQLDHVLPTGAELQFYFEVADVANEVLFLPENPLFVRPGEPLRAYSLGIGYPRPPLEVSELVAFNSTGLEDETGQTPDWVEIRNCSAEPVALHGLSVCEGLGDQDRFDFPPDIFLHPGEALVLFADDQPSAGPWHAPFVLGREGGQVMITGRTPHGARTLVDSVRYGPQRADIAYARLGCGGLWRATTPTPGGQNIRGQWTGLVFQEDTTPYFTFGFATEPSYYYQVEYNDSLDPRDWLSLPPVPGTGIEQTISQPIVPNRFYRVRVDSLEGFGIR